jgi:glutathione S-transferase
MLHTYPMLITSLALLIYFWSFALCGHARHKYGVQAPATSGHPDFERAFRIQQNTLEQLVLFLPSLWVYSLMVSPVWGAVLGIVWILGRALYIVSYARNPATRGPGFSIAFVATMILLVGGLIGTLWLMITGLPI